VIADEMVAERFTAPGDETERFMYGFSVLHCLPSSLAEEGSAALGTSRTASCSATRAHPDRDSRTPGWRIVRESGSSAR
jgi:hypothetical protein